MFEESYSYRIDETKLKYAISLFKKMVISQPSQKGLPIRFDNGYLLRKEGYKYKVWENGRKALALKTWSSNRFGSGQILSCVLDALKKSNNLVYFQTQNFEYKANEQLFEVEKTFYSLYKNQSVDDSILFEKLTHIIGNDYNKIGYLFFLKDKDKYLPCRPTRFAERFRALNIETESLNGLTWEHYLEFIQIIREIGDRISNYWNVPVSLLDAHSFVWSVHIIENELFNCDEEVLDYSDEEVDLTAEEWSEYQISKLADETLFREARERSRNIVEKNTTTTALYQRDKVIAEHAKRMASGKCMLCGITLDYDDSQGRPYLESHHIIPLSEGGADSWDNVAALCPNCHRKMHIAKRKEDQEKLLEIVRNNCEKAEIILE